MQLHPVGYRIKGFYRAAALGHLWGMTSKNAQERLKTLADQHGEAATCDAFDVSRRTLYRWQQALRQAGGPDCQTLRAQVAGDSRRHPRC